MDLALVREAGTEPVGPQGCAHSVALQGLGVGQHGGKIPSLSVLAWGSCTSLPRQGPESAQAGMLQVVSGFVPALGFPHQARGISRTLSWQLPAVPAPKLVNSAAWPQGASSN